MDTGSALRARWDKLVDHVFLVYHAHQENTLLNFYHDFEQRTLRLRAVGLPEDWVVHRLSDDELLLGDLAAIAVAMFALR